MYQPDPVDHYGRGISSRMINGSTIMAVCCHVADKHAHVWYCARRKGSVGGLICSGIAVFTNADDLGRSNIIACIAVIQ